MIYIKLHNVKVGISFWFFFVFAIICVFDKEGILWCSLLSAFLHEIGHILAMYIVKTLPDRIDIHVFNVDIIDRKRQDRTYKQDIFVISAGGIVNLILSGISFIIFAYTMNVTIEYFFVSNLILGVFNLLPIAVLDGGQILEIILLRRFSIKNTKIILNVVSFMILVPLATLGFYILFISKYNFVLLAISLYLMGILLYTKK